MTHLGVCSWSLQPTSPADLVDKLRATGLSSVQLALDPIRTGQMDEAETIARLRKANITIRSGMMGTKGEDYTTLESIKRTGGVRPDDTWPANLAAAEHNADLAARLGLTLVTFHAGFLPHDREDAERRTLIDRLRTIAAVFARRGVRIGFETGQETAATLLDVLDELGGMPTRYSARACPAPASTPGVNFDPANMILYNMGDPIEALDALAPHIVQIHIKDATPTHTAGEWGSEVAAGSGAVDWPTFFATIKKHNLDVDLMIEREAGGSRIDDIRAAAALVQRFL